jgi:hypothetical protein
MLVLKTLNLLHVMLQARRSRARFQITSIIFLIYLIFPVAPGPVVYSDFNRNEYQESSWSKVLQKDKVDNFTAIYEPIV